MSTSPISLKSDLRSASIDAARHRTSTKKWTHGYRSANVSENRSISNGHAGRRFPHEHATADRPHTSLPFDAHPRPVRLRDVTATGQWRQREAAHASNRVYAALNDDMRAATEEVAYGSSLDSEASTAESVAAFIDEPIDLPGAVCMAQEGEELVVGGSFERAPVSGAMVLESALAKAVNEWEDKETARLVRREWEVLDEDGEGVGLSPEKKARGRRGGTRPVLRERALSFEDEYEMV